MSSFTLPDGEYRFRADKPAPGSSGNGTQFWSAAENDCAIPGCVSAMVETTIPVTVTVLDSGGAPQAGLPVYAFNGTTYTNYSATTDAEGKAVMTLPQGEYRFRADKEGVQYWSGETNHCTIPGCLSAAVTVPGGGAFLITTTITYTYDGLNRLTAADYDSGEYFYYTYDDVGNRLTEEKKTTPDGLVENTAYTYDDANRMTSAGGVAYTWDDKGNLLDDGVNTYTYNHANKLTMVQGPPEEGTQGQASSIVVFAYNPRRFASGAGALGDRLSESIDGLTVIFTLDLNPSVPSGQATGLTQVLADDSHVYLYGLGRIAQTTPSEYVYFLGDALGSVRQLVDGQGIVILARVYEPYGRVLSTAGEDVTKYGFTGEWQENGLVFLRARYYDPNNGRFINKDSWEGNVYDSKTLNKWSYSDGNPVIFIDPTGNSVCYDPLSVSCSNGLAYLYSSAIDIRRQVRSGTLEPVEGFAKLADDGETYFSNIRDFVWAMTIVLDDMDDNRGPIWLQAFDTTKSIGSYKGLGEANSDYWIGQNWLPYKNNSSYDTPNEKYPKWCDPKNPEESTTCISADRWIHSLRGDWSSKYWDKTANQAYHFWFYVAVTFFDGRAYTMAANFYHDNPYGWFGFSMTDYDFIGSVEDEPPPPWMIPSSPDYDLAGRGMDLGIKLSADSNLQQLFGSCLRVLNYQTGDIGNWIRTNLKG